MAASSSALAEREEHLDVVVQRVPVALRDGQAEAHPVAGRQFGARAVGPVFGDRFLLVAERGLHLDDAAHLVQVGRRARRGRRAGTKLRTRAQREGLERSHCAARNTGVRTTPVASA